MHFVCSFHSSLLLQKAALVPEQMLPHIPKGRATWRQKQRVAHYRITQAMNMQENQQWEPSAASSWASYKYERGVFFPLSRKSSRLQQRYESREIIAKPKLNCRRTATWLAKHLCACCAAEVPNLHRVKPTTPTDLSSFKLAQRPVDEELLNIHKCWGGEYFCTSSGMLKSKRRLFQWQLTST